jgi:LysR family glycine cleavage system transcriptional activator
VSVSPNFAAKWMVHRLGRFAVDHPELDLRIAASVHRVDFAREGIDMAVRHGDGRWADLHVNRLCEDEIFPVCSPRLLDGDPPLRRPGDLRHHVLLRTLDRREWVTWLEAAGVGGLDLERGLAFEQMSMVIDAAVAGQGVGIARSTLAAADLLAGRLARPFPLAVSAANAYYVVSPKETAERPKVARFRAWLLAEAAEERRRLASSVETVQLPSSRRGDR